MFLLLGEGSVRFQHNMLKPCRLNKDLFFGLVLASKLNNLQNPNFRQLGDESVMFRHNTFCPLRFLLMSKLKNLQNPNVRQKFTEGS